MGLDVNGIQANCDHHPFHDEMGHGEAMTRCF